MPTTTRTEATTDPAAQLADAEAHLARLETERAGLAAARRDAAEAADAAALVKVIERGDKLGAELLAARIRAVTAKIAKTEASLAAIEVRHLESQRALDEASNALVTAQTNLARVQSVASDVVETRRDLIRLLGHLTRERSALIAEVDKTGSVLRSARIRQEQGQ